MDKLNRRPSLTNFLNTNQAASEFGLSQSWLAKLRLTGSGPQYMKVGKRVLYRRDEFERWIESHSRKSTSENN
jgi:predicted DNA-binding transcriptional regulator AlpA